MHLSDIDHAVVWRYQNQLVYLSFRRQIRGDSRTETSAQCTDRSMPGFYLVIQFQGIAIKVFFRHFARISSIGAIRQKVHGYIGQRGFENFGIVFHRFGITAEINHRALFAGIDDPTLQQQSVVLQFKYLCLNAGCRRRREIKQRTLRKIQPAAQSDIDNSRSDR